MKISITNIKSKENIEIRCSHIVYKATIKLTKGTFTVVPCILCENNPKDKSLPELISYLAKYGYHF